MVKLRLLGNRLSLGSWSVPFARSTNGSYEGKRQSGSYSSMASPIAKEPEVESSPPSNGAAVANGVPKLNVPTSKLIELAATITRETEKLDRYIRESGIPEPSFDADAPLNFPKLSDEVRKAREQVVRATKELGDLVAGPTEIVRWMAWDVSSASPPIKTILTSPAQQLPFPPRNPPLQNWCFSPLSPTFNTN